LRNAKGLSQTELAKICGVTKAAVSAWETGYSENIRLRALLALKNALGTTIEYIVEGVPDRNRLPPVEVVARPARRRRKVE
jgi:transcriptional regulator with XRE-family HTH domain